MIFNITKLKIEVIKIKNLKKETKEKRKSQRLNCLKVKYKLLPNGKFFKETSVKNISGNGISLLLINSLPRGTKIKSSLYFADNPTNPITTINQVIWCKKSAKRKGIYCVRMKYIHVTPKDRERFIFLFCETMINLKSLPK